VAQGIASKLGRGILTRGASVHMLSKVDLAPVSEVPKLAESPYPMRGSNGWLQQDGFILVSFSYEHYLLSYRPGTTC
jgi:hypothetical protein